MVVIRLKCEAAVIHHGKKDDDQAEEQEFIGMHDAALDQLCANWCEQGDDESSGTEDETCVDGTVSIERLQYLRDHRGRGKEADSEDEVESAGNGEVAVGQQAQV